MPALIFDYDGLLADTEALVAEVLIEVLKARGVAVTIESMATFMGSTGPVNDALWAEWVHTHVGPDTDSDELDVVAWEIIEARRHEVPLCDGVVELLDAADAAGWPIAIATGSPRVKLDRHLGHAGILDRFAEIVTAAEVAHGKPAPDIYLETARRLDRAPSDCIVFEDSLPGYEAAMVAGMSVVVVPCAVTRFCTWPDEARVVESLRDFDVSSGRAV
ncbi:MAG TPA: HAD family phosphatase [Acidimicrobiia bacterium]|nr:HAD family phosphatase [Acidimicrobiia bacterium]